MDRLLYVSMSGAQQTMRALQANNNNLANANTHGFRADLTDFRSMPVYGDGYPTRVYAMAERPSSDLTPGTLRSTDRPLDIAVEGDGWIAVQAMDGNEAYTRAGDLHIDSGGLLVTGSGLPVMGNGGAISVPPAETMVIGSDGTLSIQPVGQNSTALVVLDRIKLVKPDPAQLSKGEDGLFRLKSGVDAEADASVGVVSGAVETSNVNMVDALVNMISLQRRYESQIKLMKTAEEMDTSMDQLMKFN